MALRDINWRAWAAVGIIVLAAVLRLVDLDLIDVRYDEAIAPVFAREIAHGRHFAVVPNSGSVINHPPLWIYALSLPYWFTDSFFAVTTWRVLWDVAAVGVLMTACWRSVNWRVALIAGVLFACAPWMVWYARKLWTSVSPLSTMLLLWGIVEGWQHRRAWGWWLAGAAVAAGIASHFAGLYGLAVACPFAIALLWQKRWTSVIALLAPAVLVGALYVVADGAAGWPNLGRLTAGAGVAEVRWDADSVNQLLWLTGGSRISDLTGPSFSLWQAQAIQSLAWIDGVQVALQLLAVAFALGALLATRTTRSMLSICLMFSLIPAILLIRHGGPVQPQYLAPYVPALFALTGRMVDAVMSQRALRAIAIGLLVLICSWQIATVLRLNEFVAAGTTSMRPARGMLHALSAERAAVCNQDGMCKQPVIVLGESDPYTQQDAASWRFVGAGQDLIFTPGPQAVPYFRSASNFVSLDGSPPVKSQLASLETVARSATILQFEGATFRSVELPGVGFSQRPPVWDGEIVFGFGKVRREGVAQYVDVILIMPETAPPFPVSLSAQVFDRGVRVAQSDATVLTAASFIPNGYVVTSLGPLNVPAGVDVSAAQTQISAYRADIAATLGVRTPDGTWTGFIELNKVAK